jgi:hypothetical protein
MQLGSAFGRRVEPADDVFRGSKGKPSVQSSSVPGHFLFQGIGDTSMKTICLIGAMLLSSSVGIHAQAAATAGSAAAGKTAPPAATPGYFISERGPDYRVWKKILRSTNSLGNVTIKINVYYVELATGMHHMQNFQWVESTEEIDILPNGDGAATNGQHQVYLPGDIYAGAVHHRQQPASGHWPPGSPGIPDKQRDTLRPRYGDRQ